MNPHSVFTLPDDDNTPQLRHLPSFSTRVSHIEDHVKSPAFELCFIASFPSHTLSHSLSIHNRGKVSPLAQLVSGAL
jgi:hypothetical protein